jgi:hypothetical protein
MSGLAHNVYEVTRSILNFMVKSPQEISHVSMDIHSIWSWLITKEDLISLTRHESFKS